ncbi:hypothetical protein [Nonomuraea diastatica]|uniref:Uncharacterized protein n=1 Tax=Nonomuraea diastatica TaxID=1848329 RepID=A0A4R4V4Z3_9ACTN|nr:hypothetical protein [Nonomuraea diastatica]TDC99861.1 hypothetical protein E1294_52015 [Nonomuraea diastatica]
MSAAKPRAWPPRTTELVKQHAREKATWEKEREQLEDERDDAPMFVKPQRAEYALVRVLR